MKNVIFKGKSNLFKCDTQIVIALVKSINGYYARVE